MVVTNEEELAEKVRMIANHGSRKRYYHEILGVNSRLDSLQAAILRVKLKHLEAWNAQRRERAQFYMENLQLKEIQTPYVEEFNEHIFHQFTIRVQKRDELREYLAHKLFTIHFHYICNRLLRIVSDLKKGISRQPKKPLERLFLYPCIRT